MSFRFENLKIWHESRKFIVKVYKVTSKFPKDERFALTDQIRRAAISIALNIAEGSDKKSDKEFIKFLRISLGSVEEVVTGFYIALDLNYIKGDEFKSLYENTNLIALKINALIKSIKKL